MTPLHHTLLALALSCLAHGIESQVTLSNTITYRIDQVDYRPLGITAVDGVFVTAANGYVASARVSGNTFNKMSNLSATTDFYYAFVVQVIEEDPKYVFMINYKGDALLINVDSLFTTYSVSQRKFIRYFNEFIGNYLYKYERKKGTPYFYITSIRSSRILKVPYTSLEDFVQIKSTSGSIGYENIAIADSGTMLLLSSNGKNFEVWETSGDRYINTIETDIYAYSNMYRSVKNYPVAQTRDMFMACKTGLTCYLLSVSPSAEHSIERQYTITTVNPEYLHHVTNTRYFMVLGKTAIDMISVDVAGVSSQITTGYNDDSGYDAAFTFSNGEMYFGLLNYESHTSMKVFRMSNTACHFACTTCTASGQIDKCTQCQKGYTLTGTTCIRIAIGSNYLDSSNAIITSCGTGFYVSDTRECKECPVNCQTCSNSTGFCTQCTSGKNIQTDGSCNIVCQTKEYLDAGKCRRCHISCKTCSGPRNNQCTGCDSGSPNSSGNCSPPVACTSNQQYNWLKNICEGCDSQYSSTCSECTMQDLGYSCLTCTSGYSEILGLCYNSCPAGSVSQGNKCTLCEENTSNKLFTINGCNSSCPSGYNLTDNIYCMNLGGDKNFDINSRNNTSSLHIT